MFNKQILQDILMEYKKQFSKKLWPNEQYKWIAVQHFQENWDVNAEDFPWMLKSSLAKTSNLLASVSNFPAKMIVKFAEAAPEDVRAMFIDLFDESKDLWERMDRFKQQSGVLLQKYGNGAAQHFQYENSISTYLWLRYPDKYYIFKLGIVKETAIRLESSYTFKKGAYADNIRNHFAFYNELSQALQQDAELKSLLAAHLTADCYPDPALHTMVIDLGHFIGRYMKDKALPEETWFPDTYTPGFSVDDWRTLLQNEEIFTESSLQIMKRFLDNGGQASCSELSKKYGESHTFYSSGSVALAKRIINKTNCPVLTEDTENSKWWPVLYVGKYADSSEQGAYIWRLRNELKQALEQMDLSTVKLLADEKEKPAEMNSYSKENFLQEVFMTESKYDRLNAVLQKKKNIILQGAPGVGKTFAARRLAWSIMGEQDNDRVEFVQFHQNYSYEDFVMGYKPVEDGFELKNGIFYRFCQKAASHPEQDFFFIIDEINRGNLSKIFGELLMLIEADYRGQSATLAYNGLSFSVPQNLYLIGMMNTADRSLAMIDYALRRRFSFFDMEPGFDSEGFRAYQKALDNETFNTLIEQVRELNQEIAQDKSLGKGFCIGHSYFCGAEICTEEWMRDIVDFDILPMLSEYWFDDNNKLQRWENILRGIFQ